MQHERGPTIFDIPLVCKFRVYGFYICVCMHPVKGLLGNLVLGLGSGVQGSGLSAGPKPRAPSYVNSRLLGYVIIGYVEPRT